MRKFITKTFTIFFALSFLFTSFLPLYAQENIVEDLIETVNRKAEERENKDTGESEEEETDPIIDEDKPETEISSQYFDISLIRGGQSAFTGNVDYTIQITSHIDSPRTKIEWNLPTALRIIPKHSEYISMQKGQTYTLKASLKPLTSGIYTVTVSAISWQHNTNYTNSASDDVTFNENLVLQPVTSSYTTGNILKFVLIFLVAGGAIGGVIWGVKKLAPKAKQWLTPPV